MKAAVHDPGRLTWSLTFRNGTFGVIATSGVRSRVVRARARRAARCKHGRIRLAGRCRAARIVYGRGGSTVKAAGTVTITITPSAAARKALRRALREHRALRVNALLSFLATGSTARVSYLTAVAVRPRTTRSPRARHRA